MFTAGCQYTRQGKTVSQEPLCRETGRAIFAAGDGKNKEQKERKGKVQSHKTDKFHIFMDKPQ